MFRMNSVEFNKDTKLSNIDKMSNKHLFQAWINRIREYYMAPAAEMDKNQNGFASLILQLCGIDAAASFLDSDLSVEKKIRNFCHKMITRSEKYNLSNSNYHQELTNKQIDQITKHLYFQYRCGLVHNGFTLQFGKHKNNNKPNHIFLISYETPLPIMTNGFDQSGTAFIVNPLKFRSMLQFELQFAQNSPSEVQEKIGSVIRNALATEIRISKIFTA